MVLPAVLAGLAAKALAQDQYVQPYPDRGKDINVPFVNIHLGHGFHIDTPYAHIEKYPGEHTQVFAPYTHVENGFDSNGVHVRAPYANVDAPRYGQSTRVEAPFTRVGEGDGVRVHAPFTNVEKSNIDSSTQVRAPFTRVEH